MWGGRFGGGPDPLFTAFNDSLAVDARLVHDDVAGSIAWAEALRGAGVLTADEAAALETALRRIDEEAARDPAAVRSAAAEDVHTWVELQLIDRLGDLGKKLQTSARSFKPGAAGTIRSRRTSGGGRGARSTPAGTRSAGSSRPSSASPSARRRR